MKYISFFCRALIGCMALCASVYAQVTTLVVPFATGGPTDASARIVAAALSRETGMSFVVENVPGAGATIGATKVAQAKADGYTLLWGTGSLPVTPYLYPGIKYDPIKSFAPIGLVGTQPFVLVVQSNADLKTLDNLVTVAKASPGKLNFSSTGQGALGHLTAELFKSTARFSATHIPYNGGAPGMNALLAGDVNFLFDTPTTTVPLVKSGKLRALAVTGSNRWVDLPDVPTMQELGFAKFEVSTWFGMVAPAGSPPDRVAYLSKNLLLVLANPSVINALKLSGFNIEPSTPDELARRIVADSVRWGAVIKAAGIKME